ncbi:hypothetical protein ACFLZY_00810 [Patescibacteria group bacterium]
MDDAESVVEGLMPDFAVQLVNSDEIVTGRIAETNAEDFGLDDYFVEEAEFEFGGRQVRFSVWIELEGSQSGLEEPWNGNHFRVRVTGSAKRKGHSWQIKEHTIHEIYSNTEEHA